MSLSSFTVDTTVIYRGISEGLGHDRVYVVRNGRTEPLKHHKRHSASFSWGYAGSGPAETARCILADFLALQPLEEGHDGLYGGGSIPEIDSLYQSFKFDFVATMPHNGGSWELSGAAIAEWLSAHPPATTCATCRQPIDPDDPFPCLYCTEPGSDELL